MERLLQMTKEQLLQAEEKARAEFSRLDGDLIEESHASKEAGFWLCIIQFLRRGMNLPHIKTIVSIPDGLSLPAFLS